MTTYECSRWSAYSSAYSLACSLACSLAVFSLAGCEGLYDGYDLDDRRPAVVDFDTTLGSIGAIEPFVLVTQDEGHPSKFALTVRLLHPMRPPHADGARCPKFPSLVAALDGNSVPLTTQGGWTSDNFPVCMAPAISRAIQPSALASSVMTIGDPTKTITLELGDRLQLRTAALVAPPAQGYRPGESISVRWSHRDDLDKLPELSVERTSEPLAIAPATITRAGDTLTFPLPEGLGTGAHVLRLRSRTAGALCGSACSLNDLRVVDVLFDVRAP